MDGRFLLLVLGFAPSCSPCLHVRNPVSYIVSYRPRSDVRYVGSPSALRFYSPKRLELRFVKLCQSINQSISVMSISSYASSDPIVRLVNRLRTNSVTHTRPVSRAWFSPSFKRCS
eukprot:scaffold13644_cov117-Isochrysis_galbana.AAC.7